ncbi:MAG: thioredoxin [Spirulina sp. SIO3F2]|nr:thioredoxin [Spirulina sp. SIO3F2]
MTASTVSVEYVTQAELNSLIESTELLVMDFTATWCGPCRVVAPMMERLAAENRDRVKVVKVDIDQHRDCATQLQIRSLPTVLMFKAGQEVERLIGSKPYGEFDKALQQHL